MGPKVGTAWCFFFFCMLHHTSGVCVFLVFGIDAFLCNHLNWPTTVAVVTALLETITAKHSRNASRCSRVVPVVRALFGSAGAFVAALLL